MSFTSWPSQSRAIARSSVVRTSPTLPPKAMRASGILALPGSRDRNADIRKGCGNRRMGLVNGHGHGGHLCETFEHGGCNRARGRLDEAITLRAKHLRGGFHHVIIAHRMGELVGVRSLRKVDVEREIEQERLANVGLV